MSYCRPLAAVLLVVALTVPAGADEQKLPPPTTTTYARDQITGILAAFRHIATAQGIEDSRAIEIGGTRQWITVRGKDRRNPILLLIHGGPASPEMGTSWAYTLGWEDYFTVVEWDQRGAGKSYGLNDPAAIGPTLTLSRMVADAAELVQYLRSSYGQDKIFVIGHSFGSVIGLSLAHEHPEWLYAYIGMGQVVSGIENERASYRLVLAKAEADRNDAAIAELKSIAPYPGDTNEVPLPKIMIERKWSDHYGGLVLGHDGIDYVYHLARLSPDYAADDVAAIDKGSELSLPRLLPSLAAFDYEKVTDFGCPIILFNGRHDTTTPPEIATEWLARVHAPATKVVWFENSAHMMLAEEPGTMLVHLVEDVRPFATR